MTAPAPRPDQPPSEVCPICESVTPYVWDEAEQEWELDGEWWHLPELRVRYICSRWCHAEALQQRDVS